MAGVDDEVDAIDDGENSGRSIERTPELNDRRASGRRSSVGSNVVDP